MMIMMTASSVSRISVGFGPPCRTTAEIATTSIEVMVSVRSSVSVGFAETPRKVFRVADDAEGRPERDDEEPEKDRRTDERVVEPREEPVLEQSEGGHGRRADEEEPVRARGEAKRHRAYPKGIQARSFDVTRARAPGE